MTSDSMLQPGVPVLSATFGRGVVEFSKGKTTLVRFSNGIEECLTSELTVLRSAADDYLQGRTAPTSNVLLRLLAETIRSINDAWGVFSPSRIDLYPHQLWVCKKVTEQWPVRWVIADDVGLGKTIEAGLILWRLFRLGLVQRLLILCPASLVNQWQERLYSMFDIRTAQYDPDQDSDRVDFWKINPFVVASFHTLRADKDGRHDRMTQTDPWDLVIVDEAHHLNFDEAAGMTQAHRLIRILQDASRIQSLLFFTGTPHRGKHFGFFALMSLVRPDLFDPRKPIGPQLALLSQALMRNNKYHVTDLRGERLFREPKVETIPYSYGPAEDSFYRMMTDFIASGRTYATGLDGGAGRAVMLVLISLQKLASSSVAAVRSALQKRLARLREATSTINRNRASALTIAGDLERESDDLDAANSIVEDRIATLVLELMEDECSRLEELIEAADAVTSETKIRTIIETVRGLPDDESVLFFTEYKVTQSLLLTSLFREFGPGCATFINGDEALSGVLMPDGSRRALKESRHTAKDRFNRGSVRFLISTEAAGEGVDLQERCSRLIHVDLPWNPMRLHQRVGRLNRIGQRDIVKVMLFQNPDTVESRIWTLLNEKLERIRASINAVTEEPEDLHQLVLGISRPGELEQIFSVADSVPRSKLDEWFDSQSGQIGGEDAVRVVQDLLGHAQHFDFVEVSERIPRFDLPDLATFFRLALRHNRRLVAESDGALAFKTPEAWLRLPGVKARYDDVHFERKTSAGERGTIVGVGTRLLDAAIGQATQFEDAYAVVAKASEKRLLLVYRCYDLITGNPSQPKSIICGVAVDSSGLRVLKDGDVFRVLNELVNTARLSSESEPVAGSGVSNDGQVLSQSESLIRGAFAVLDLPFRQPELELLGIISYVA
jgi:superfamily II DNA or RNA helicase